jgi:hypothetical protein
MSDHVVRSASGLGVYCGQGECRMSVIEMDRRGGGGQPYWRCTRCELVGDFEGSPWSHKAATFFAAVHDSLHHGGSPTAIVIENAVSGTDVAEVLGSKATGRPPGLAIEQLGAGEMPVGAQVTRQAGSIRKPRTPHRFVQAAEQALAEHIPTDLSGLELAALMVDGVQFADHECVIALGITVDGIKLPLAIEDGSAESDAPATRLMVGLRERGLDVTLPILAVLTCQALCRAVQEVFDHPVIARCQLRAIGDVKARLPQELHTVAEGRMRQAYRADAASAAQALLESLAAELDEAHPEAAGSLRAGLPETLTVLRLGISPTLTRTLASTAAIDSMIEICRERTRNVKNRSDGRTTSSRTNAARSGTVMPQRRLNGYRDLPDLRAALEDEAGNAVPRTNTTRRPEPDMVTATVGLPRDMQRLTLDGQVKANVHCPG